MNVVESKFMKKIFTWIYSKDFTFWQNMGHFAVVLTIALLSFQYLIASQ